VEGLTIFAVFFVAASAIERLIEPLTLFYGQDKKADLDAKAAKAKETVEAAYVAQAAYLSADDAGKTVAKSKFDEAKSVAQNALVQAATAKAGANKITGNRAVVVWGAASAIGILGASMLKLYLLKQVGIASPPRPMELLATGLIIGAGTKPMHDLVKLIEKRKEDATNATSGGSTALTT
jgi:NADPH:quinone reductase-like Zn-dependent oxidoreductase